MINSFKIKTKVTKETYIIDVLKTYGDNRKVKIIKKLKFTIKVGVENTVKWYKKIDACFE